MKSQTNILRQIQELVLTRDEHNSVNPSVATEPFSASIDSLKGTLDKPTLALFDRLYKRNHVVISAINRGCCTACGFGVPTLQANLVRQGQHLVTCSNCGRILYPLENDEVRNPTVVRPDTEEIILGISRFSALELMVPQLKATDKVSAIKELSAMLGKHGFIDKPDVLVQAALEREAILPTVMDNGIAFPHVRGVEGGGLAMAAGVSKKGIDWDGQQVKIVFLTAIPLAVSAYFLNLMSGLCKAMAKPDVYDAVLNSKTPAGLWRIMLQSTRGLVR